MHRLAEMHWNSDRSFSRFCTGSLCFVFSFVLLACFPSLSQAADSFARVVMEPGPRAAGAAEVAPVDVDGDGDSDVMVAAESGTLAWLENDASHVNFVFHGIDSGVSVAGVQDVDPVDFEGDGDVDLVAAASDTFAWYENDGTNSGWTRHVIDAGTTAAGASDIDAADFNGNGSTDLLTAAADTFAWYENDGTDLTFTRFVIAAGSDASGARDNDPVDFDGDGDMDAVTVAAGDTVAWYDNHNPQPDRFQRREVASGPAVADARDVEFADVDRDGNMDLAVAAGDTFVWFQNQGNDKNFTRHVIDAGPAASGAADVDPIDFNRDGNVDFITAAGTAGVFAWYENDGTNLNFIRHPVERGTHAAGARDIEPADVDVDGDLDVMTGADGAGEFAWQAQPNVFIVDDDGAADTGPANCGALTSAPATIADGLSRVTVGDTVWVCPGTYTENLTVGTGQPRLTLTSVGDSTGTILTAADPVQPALEVFNTRDVRLDGLGFKDGPVRLSATLGVEFRNSRFLAGGTTSDTALHLMVADSTVVTGNTFAADAWSLSAPADNDPDSRAIALDDASHSLIEGNRITGYDIGIIFENRSDTNLVRDNRIDTNWLGVGFLLDPGGEPRGNELRLNTVRVSNTGILLRGDAEGTSPTNVAVNNDFVGNYEGVENQTERIFDARENWWGASSGPSGDAADPYTGMLAAGTGDAITWEGVDGSTGADTNVAFDTPSSSPHVGGALGSVTNGCVIERSGIPSGIVGGLRSVRDGVLHTEAGRILTDQYYRYFGARTD